MCVAATHSVGLRGGAHNGSTAKIYKKPSEAAETARTWAGQTARFVSKHVLFCIVGKSLRKAAKTLKQNGAKLLKTHVLAYQAITRGSIAATGSDCGGSVLAAGRRPKKQLSLCLSHCLSFWKVAF